VKVTSVAKKEMGEKSCHPHFTAVTENEESRKWRSNLRQQKW
jgi:hypothetical protein